MSVLDRIATLYPPSVIGEYLPFPGQEDQRWDYECTGGPIEREARRRLNACRDDGVFELFWKRAASGKRERAASARNGSGGTGGEHDEDEEEEDGGGRVRLVDENAWDLVQWVIRLWKRDQELYAENHPDLRESTPALNNTCPVIGRRADSSWSVPTISHAIPKRPSQARGPPAERPDIAHNCYPLGLPPIRRPPP
jgi:hypothetical protein